MNSLVVGYGSIGARHARILSEMGHQTAVVTARSVDYPDVFSDLATALRARAVDYVVVANATALHFSTVTALATLGFQGTVLVEKPLFSRMEAPLPNSFRHFFVAYNLRFHPLIQRVRTLIGSETVLSATCYVGQYLPDWRPDADYRQSYSSHADRGGGVLRDLSHELDYLAYLLGPWRRVCAIGGHFSALEGDSDDTFGLMMAFERCPLVMLSMNYTDRAGRRQIIMNTDNKTIMVDLVSGCVTVNNVTEVIDVPRDETYRAMHAAALDGDGDVLCSLPEALDTLALIEGAEHAAKQAKWIDKQ